MLAATTGLGAVASTSGGSSRQARLQLLVQEYNGMVELANAARALPQAGGRHGGPAGRGSDLCPAGFVGPEEAPAAQVGDAGHLLVSASGCLRLT
jgi:hypothetical protein